MAQKIDPRVRRALRRASKVRHRLAEKMLLTRTSDRELERLEKAAQRMEKQAYALLDLQSDALDRPL